MCGAISPGRSGWLLAGALLGVSSLFWWQHHPQSGVTLLSALWQNSGKKDTVIPQPMETLCGEVVRGRDSPAFPH